MKVTELRFEDVRDFLLERVEPHPRTTRQHFRCNCVEIFIQWRHEVLTKLGDVNIRVEKQSKLSPFKIKVHE